ncbi:SET domain-containing protein [Punctularia strigosozonata HHB-11173 SS5]|uniref:SET domain-containing protein n=1 Tax=Punctularia strigosozonata (strain HHB-11173) TaxID=741275 RepID=UPI00044174BF|nr:SET domain-containing protein [Punctularia strigosozonata HHB-11173 SS5]EIN06655.1 SET domain-containing protein [Punctularia strigosozonata HHB-11173 SS5]
MFGSNSDHGGDSNADDESDGVQEARRRLRALPSRLSEVQGKMAPLASRSTAPNRPSKTSFSRASSSTPRSTQLSRRQKIQADWDELCNLHHAERVMIVNDVDDEEIPPGLENFKYTEFRYKFSAAVPNPSDEAFFVSCECAPNPKSHRRQNLCGDANQCGCQELAQHPEDDGRRQIAYTPQGLFKVTAWRPTLVVECNKKCHCASTRSSCLNRVSQRPRSIPIEVFKTANGRGWGARTDRVTTIPEGKVLGLYTGEVIRRSSIPQMSKLHKSYMFDLDAQENQDSDEGDQDPDRYSVSAYEYGNWTRFVNHSCEPNAMVYSVIFDTIPEVSERKLSSVSI